MPEETNLAVVRLEHLVGDLKEFQAEQWRRHPLYRPQASRNEFRELISLDDVDYILADPRTRPPFVRVIVNGRKLDNRLITRQVKMALQPIDDVPDTAAIMKHFKNGATIVVESLQDSIRPVGTLCKDITSRLARQVHAQALITPPSKQGFATHFDALEVLIAQFSGTKTWRIYERRSPPPIAGSDIPVSQVGKPIMEVDLKAGDVLYVPWGYPHDATSRESVAAHLILAIRPPTWADVLSQVLSDTLKEEILGESPELVQSEAEFKADFLSRLDGLCRSINDPEKRGAVARLAWEQFIGRGSAAHYPTIAEIAGG